MATQTFNPKNFDKLFQAEAEDNPQNAQVGKFFSGQAQHLKSADNAVFYKNHNGVDVEETGLVQTAHTQSIQTNQTDTYDIDVSSELTETAPDIQIQHTLSQAVVHNTHNLNLIMNTQDERETYHQAAVERYHQSLQHDMPTELDQTIQQSGIATINQQQQEAKKQNINSSMYKQQFGEYNYEGQIQVSQNTNLGSNTLVIGGGGDMSGIDFTLRQGIQEAIPKIATKIVGKSITLPPIITQGFIITGTLELTGNLIAKGQSPIPVTVDKDGINLDLQNKMNDYFAGLSFKSFSDFSSPMSDPPTIEVGNENGNMEFSNGAQFEVIGPSVKVVYHSAFTISEPNYEGWKLQSESSATLTTYFTPNTLATAYRPAERFAKSKLSEFYQHVQKVSNAVAGTLSTPPSPVITGISTFIILVGSTIAFLAMGGA